MKDEANEAVGPTIQQRHLARATFDRARSVRQNDQDKPAGMAPVTLIPSETRPPFPLGFIR